MDLSKAERVEGNTYCDFVVLPVEDNNLKFRGIKHFEDVLHIRFVTPMCDTVCRPARQEDKARFKKAWQAYAEDNPISSDEVSLSTWEEVTPAQRKNLQNRGFRSVNDVARATDAQVGFFGMGGLELRAKAQAFLEEHKKNSDLAKEMPDVDAIFSVNNASPLIRDEKEEPTSKVGRPKKKG